MNYTTGINLRPLTVAIGFLLAFIFLGCASLNLENYHFSGEEVLFATSFDQKPDELVLQSHGTPSINVIRDGVLHMRDTTYPNRVDADFMNDDWYILEVPFGEGSRTDLRMKLSSEQPEFHLNFLLRHPARLLFVIRNHGIHVLAFSGDGSRVYVRHLDRGLNTERWYDLTFLNNDGQMSLFVDGRRRTTIPISQDIPVEGFFGFEAHGEAWFSDMTVVRFDQMEIQ